ncbi:uncharacterized protein LOC141720546 isoform X2 [Apium graveolens]|uniref:uncharacterized protein LOC141720546 isoform X2 n=1 Tax=Apium graveolens TaxID=4045 RepID=UPI003D79FE3F
MKFGITRKYRLKALRLCHLHVVGDRRGAVFGGYVEASLRPSLKRRYQGTNNTFVFTNTFGLPVIFGPTGAFVSFLFSLKDMDIIGVNPSVKGDSLGQRCFISVVFLSPELARQLSSRFRLSRFNLTSRDFHLVLKILSSIIALL